jgi:hypothetical protein
VDIRLCHRRMKQYSDLAEQWNTNLSFRSNGNLMNLLTCQCLKTKQKNIPGVQSVSTHKPHAWLFHTFCIEIEDRRSLCIPRLSHGYNVAQKICHIPSHQSAFANSRNRPITSLPSQPKRQHQQQSHTAWTKAKNFPARVWIARFRARGSLLIGRRFQENDHGPVPVNWIGDAPVRVRTSTLAASVESWMMRDESTCTHAWCIHPGTARFYLAANDRATGTAMFTATHSHSS